MTMMMVMMTMSYHRRLTGHHDHELLPPTTIVVQYHMVPSSSRTDTIRSLTQTIRLANVNDHRHQRDATTTDIKATRFYKENETSKSKAGLHATVSPSPEGSGGRNPLVGNSASCSRIRNTIHNTGMYIYIYMCVYPYIYICTQRRRGTTKQMIRKDIDTRL